MTHLCHWPFILLKVVNYDIRHEKIDEILIDRISKYFIVRILFEYIRENAIIILGR